MNMPRTSPARDWLDRHGHEGRHDRPDPDRVRNLARPVGRAVLWRSGGSLGRKTQTRAQNVLGGGHKSMAGNAMAQKRKNAKLRDLMSPKVLIAKETIGVSL
jgi:hypothetical protein